MKNKNHNKMITGMIAGIVIPFIVFVLVVLSKMNRHTLMDFLGILHEQGILPKLLSLCLLPNLILFFIFLRGERLRSAQGVILSMFIYGIIILLFKFVG